jgi:hypothetical protein
MCVLLLLLLQFLLLSSSFVCMWPEQWLYAT